MATLRIPPDSPFPPAALPWGVGSPPGDGPRAVVAIGAHAIDLAALERSGGLTGLGLDDGTFQDATLNRFAAQGRDVWSAVRGRLTEVVEVMVGTDELSSGIRLHELSELEMAVPVAVGDYVDFYSNIHHATNVGRLFRPDAEPLLPNWRHLPVGYHGRAGTIVGDRATIPRPCGLRQVDGVPEYGPSRALDIELEVGFVIGPGSERGRPIPIDEAADHIFGVCLVNDWSARDIQSFEYVPLGPFLGKSFATSMSPWILPLDALEPFRIPSPVQDPPVAEYLRTSGDWGFDLAFEVELATSDMTAAGRPPDVISRTTFDMYWTPPQQLAHLTANGASTRPGDLFASGTVSGPARGSEGSCLELTRNGAEPVRLSDGSTRAFLSDGDTVTLRGWAGAGPARIGFGSVTGTVGPPVDHSAPRTTAPRTPAP